MRTVVAAPVRLRAIVIGLLLIPALCWWSIQSEVVNGGSEMIEASLLVIAVFVLFVLVLLNQILEKLAPALAFSRAELLTIYVMQTTSLGLAGLGQIQFLSQVLPAGMHYATPQNHWEDFRSYIPSWWIPEPSAIESFYRGHDTLFTLDHLRGWAKPIASWIVFILLFQVSFLCMCTILRKQWVQQERLSFPLTCLPLELTQDSAAGAPIRQGSFWAAFAVVCLFRSVAAVHRLLPQFPDVFNLSVKGQGLILSNTFAALQPPWNSIGYVDISFHPMIVGISYFIPLEISFSEWFFYLFAKAEYVLCTAWGFRQPGDWSDYAAPYTADQGCGAFLMIAILSLWSARLHLQTVFKAAFSRERIVDDSDEPMPYRAAVAGLFLSVAGLVAYAVLGGIPWGLALVFIVLYLLMVLACARLRAEAGPMLGYGPEFNSHQMMIELPGPHVWDARALTAFAYFKWFDSDYRTVAMPQQMDAFNIAHSSRIPARQWTGLIFCASFLAAIAAFISVLTIYYHYGAASGMGDNSWRIENGTMPFEELMCQLHPSPNIQNHLPGMAGGALAVLTMTEARHRFLWLPFHPAGFVLANIPWAMDWIWFPTLVGWAAKALILRYGGLRAFRAAAPVFFGLILGDVVASCGWSIYGLIVGARMYMFFPG